MPAVEIRAAQQSDIENLLSFDHSYVSDHVWQMDYRSETNQLSLTFSWMRLPRTLRVEYPRPLHFLSAEGNNPPDILVALLAKELVGYIRLNEDIAPLSTWVTDLVVDKKYRRQGIGSALILAGQDWARSHPTSRRMVLEMQLKNYPAICLAQKLGFDFCGYNDHYYPNHDIAILWEKWLR